MIKKELVVPMLAFAFFLVLLPLGSYYYLKKGYDYRLAALNELKNDYGTIPTFDLVDTDSQQISTTALKVNLVLLNIFPAAYPELQKTLGETLVKLHDQFDDRNDLQFIFQVPSEQSPSISQLQAYQEQYEFADPGQCHLLATPTTTIAALNRDSLPRWQLNDSYPYFFLTDTTLTIRHYYDYSKLEDVKKLVEHIAIMLPRQEEPDIIFKRDTEK